ncbi:MAG TPA: ISAs1 family transposase [Pseudonocardiaceae bacterium]|nr:ISAs1 family transposase [Pseudonocardiaceae bacterium]
MAQSVSDPAVSPSAGPMVALPVARVCTDLLEVLGGVSDGRSDQGRDHPVGVVLALAAAAVVAGMRGYTAITGWVRDVPAGVLADLYVRAGAVPAGPPSKTTIWRVLTDADADAFDAAIGRWLSGLAGLTTAPDADGCADSPVLMQVRLDGKTIRGAKDAEGNQRHLLAALVGPDAAHSVVAAQAEVGPKTNEVPMAAAVLGQIDLNGKIVTADALHTVKATAKHIRERGGEFVLPVKENRRALFDALDALAWKEVPIAHRGTDKGHGRITTRTIQVLPAPPDLPFPHVNQVFLVERYVSDLAGQPISAVAALGVASPAPGRASPAELAGYVREQWSIESLHWIRDTLYQEDKSQIRTRSGPRIMAALRNLAIGALRLAGRTDITEATRWAARRMDRPFTILGLTP